MSILETIEAFNAVRKAYKVARLSNFVDFENFQNITGAHKSRNARAGSYDFLNVATVSTCLQTCV